MATYSWNFTTRATCTVILLATPTRLPDWPLGAPSLAVVGYLLPLCQPPVLLPSHIVESPVGTFFLLPHHLSLFSLLLGEKGDKWKRNEWLCFHRGECVMVRPRS